MTVTRPEQVEQAREIFFEHNSLPVDQIGHAILKSWIRCADMGLSVRDTPKTEARSATEVRLLQEKHEALRRISRPELDALYSEARELSGIVILTNAKGEILDLVGDPAFADKAAQVALRPGALWSEEGTGTNAIGTAIAERRGIIVNGPEHYYQDHKILTCAATPIIDPRGATLGVLDISVPASQQPAHTLGLVRLAVEQIEHRLFRNGFEGCQTLRFQTDPHLLGVAREGILVIKDTVVVAANRRGLSLVGKNWDDIDHLRLDDIFEANALATHQQKLIAHDGREFYAQLDPDEAHARSALPSNPEHLADLELKAIQDALRNHNGNISAAAAALGVHRSTIYRRLGHR